MLSATIAIHWHDDGHPVYSLDFQPLCDRSRRLATAGGDKNVRIWRIQMSDTGEPQETSVEYLSTLRKHSQAVNSVRFNPEGNLIASAGDDGMLIIWSLSSNIVQEFGVQDDDMKESWVVHQCYNTNLEIYDICWSPDSNFVATGSMDNTIKIYNILTGQKVTEILNHSHYVQGIAWDPLNGFLATQSADRSVNIHSLRFEPGVPSGSLCVNLHAKLIRAELPTTKISNTHLVRNPCAMVMSPEKKEDVSEPLTEEKLKETDPTLKHLIAKKASNLYHSENLQSFFRRLNFSPDGSLLLVPLGIYKYESTKGSTLDGNVESISLNTVYIYTRSGLNQPPVCHLPGLQKPAIAVAFSPLKFRLSTDDITPVFALPYKMVFAVATHDAIIIYDTERLQPLGILSNLHYLSITDLCWDNDGQSIMISSAEGFCSVVKFSKQAFGPTLEEKNENLHPQTPVNTEKKVNTKSSGNSFQNQYKEETEIMLDQTETSKTNVFVLKNSSDGLNSDRNSKSSSGITYAGNTTRSKEMSDTSCDINTTEPKTETTGSVHNNKVISQFQLQQFMANPVSIPDESCITLEMTKRTVSEVSLSEQPKKKRITPTLVNR